MCNFLTIWGCVTWVLRGLNCWCDRDGRWVFNYRHLALSLSLSLCRSLTLYLYPPTLFSLAIHQLFALGSADVFSSVCEQCTFHFIVYIILIDIPQPIPVNARTNTHPRAHVCVRFGTVDVLGLGHSLHWKFPAINIRLCSWEGKLDDNWKWPRRLHKCP